MEITPQTVIAASALLGACGAIAAVVIRLVHWLDRQKKQDTELAAIKDEECVIVYGLLACLDGLKQLGANGNVTEAHNALDKHINKAAHKQSE